jgi:hypothetical protein
MIKLTIISPYIDNFLENELSLTRVIQQEVLITKAILNGQVNKPAGELEHLVDTVNPLRNEMQRLLDLNHSRTQPVSVIASVQQKRQDITDEMDGHAAVTKNGLLQVATLKGEQMALKVNWYTIYLLQLKTLVAATVGACEGVLFTMQSQSAGLGLLVSIILGSIAGLLIAILLKVAARFIAKADTTAGYKKRYVRTTVIAFAVATLLGIGRLLVDESIDAVTVHIGVTDTSIHQSSLFMAVLYGAFSFGLFSCALHLELQNKLSAPLRKRIARYLELQKEIHVVQRQVDAAISERKRLQNDHRTIGASASSRIEFAKAFEQRVVQTSQELIETYNAHNLRNRKNSTCPPFFTTPVPWNFKLYFTNSFQKQN